MNQTFIYYTVLFLIIFITISNLVENYRYSPKKIKNIIGIAFLLQIIRIVSLIALALVSDQRYISLFKYVGFLDIIYIPLMALIAFYILLRSDKINFQFFKFAPIVLTGFYIGVIAIFKPFFKMSWEYGYVITTEKQILLKSIYILFLVAILSSLILFKKEKHSDKKGIVFLGVTLAFIIIENSLELLGVKFLNGAIISELILCILGFYIVLTFKKNRISIRDCIKS